MTKLFVLSVLSVSSLIILRKFGVQTDVVVLDQWVDKIMTMFSFSA